MNKEDLVIGAPYSTVLGIFVFKKIGKYGDILTHYLHYVDSFYHIFTAEEMKELEFYDYEAHRRSLRPNVKKGQPVIVWDSNASFKHVEYFHSYEGDTILSRATLSSYPSAWRNCELLPGYDYTYGEDND